MQSTTTKITRLNVSTGKSHYSLNSLNSGSSRSSRDRSRNENFPSIRVYQNGPGPGKYSRSSSIGCSKTDLTLTQSPAFSIGKASRWNNFGIIISPGPVYCPKIVHRKIPGYYMSSKPIDFEFAWKSKIPGPAAYTPRYQYSSLKHSVPAFSMGKAVRFPTYVC